MQKKKAILIVLDGVGCGNAPDAEEYGDAGANTLRGVMLAASPSLPNLARLGLLNLPDVGPKPTGQPTGGYGRCRERSAGKDTTTGHWEMAGLYVREPFPTYPNGFPPELMEQFEQMIGRRTLGNYPASGTAILDELGEEHMRTGRPIVYTSADSVFQIAAHESVIPPEALWRICEQARGLLTGPNAVGRVIARPFTGAPGRFTRTGNRRDFSLTPPGDTMLDILKRNGLTVAGVGKIEDIFAHRGLTQTDHAVGNDACLASTLRMMEQPWEGLIFSNLVDFDSLYGHRNDVDGFARALMAVDAAIPAMLKRLGPDDLLMFTADHGCDPTFPGTDHTRELVPLICYTPGMRPVDLGLRETYSDISATILDFFGIANTLEGTSFLGQLIKEDA